MSSLHRFVATRMEILHELYPRYKCGFEFMSDLEIQRMAEALDGLDWKRLANAVNRGYGKYIQSKTGTLPENVYEVVNDYYQKNKKE
jgi:hypothetical protein